MPAVKTMEHVPLTELQDAQIQPPDRKRKHQHHQSYHSTSGQGKCCDLQNVTALVGDSLYNMLNRHTQRHVATMPHATYAPSQISIILHPHSRR